MASSVRAGAPPGRREGLRVSGPRTEVTELRGGSAAVSQPGFGDRTMTDERLDVAFDKAGEKRVLDRFVEKVGD